MPLSENFILTEKKRLVELPYSIAEFSPDETKIIQYEFMPLTSGKIFLNTAEVLFEAWNQTHPLILSNEIAIDVLENENLFQINSASPIDEYFLNEKTTSIEPHNKSYTNIEKNEITQILKFRNNLKILFVIFIFAILIFLTLFIIFGISKKSIPKKIFAICFSLCIIIEISISIPLTKKYVIIENKPLYQIPEANTTPATFIEEKSLLEVRTSTKGWYQIKTGNNRKLWIEKINVTEVDNEFRRYFR